MSADITRDPKASPEVFVQAAHEFMSRTSVAMPKSAEEAYALVDAFDGLIDVLNDQMKSAGQTYTEKTILIFGGLLGEAFRLIFQGSWYFSVKQNRWVIRVLVDQEEIEMNVFNKIEKRLTRGMEESIRYYFDGIVSMFLQK